jgi:F-type H+-transporting ATPase subunit delta
VTASPLNAKQADAIKEKLERKTGKTVILTNTVDAGIIGGVLLKYGGEQIDRSVKSSLKAISNVISKADV